MASRRRNGNTESVDNYLKAILALGGQEENRVAITALAEHLAVAPASVTNMLQKLSAAQSPLVRYERHRGVQLSKSGRKRALEVLRHHRLIETFLYRVLDYPLEEVHAEAERLEHFISERFEERIAAKLGHPTIDPHGHSIPTLDGEIAVTDSMLLADVGCVGIFRIHSVSDHDVRQVRWMEARGMTPGARLRVRKIPSAAGFDLSIGRSGKPFLLSRDVAEQVRIVNLRQN
jgi:DtxR family Mn-dependent transcriptional regulator